MLEQIFARLRATRNGLKRRERVVFMLFEYMLYTPVWTTENYAFGSRIRNILDKWITFGLEAGERERGRETGLQASTNKYK